MVLSNEEDELMLQGMVEGWKAELKETFKGRVIIVSKPVFGERNEKKYAIKSKLVEEFLDEYTVKTNNKKDKITTEDLHEKFCVWYNRFGVIIDTIHECEINSAQEFGKIMSGHFPDYDSGRLQYRGKTKRYYSKLKYKSMEMNTVKEFLDKYTEKTEDPKDRISLTKLLTMFNYLDYKPRGGCEIFKTKAMLGEYKVKTCYEKLVKGPGRVVEPCLMRAKPTEELKELFLKEGLTQKGVEAEN